MNIRAIAENYHFDSVEEIENGVRITTGGETFEVIHHEADNTYTADQDGISLCFASDPEEALDFIKQFSNISEDHDSYSVKRYIVYCKEIGKIVGSYDGFAEATRYIQEENDALGETKDGGLKFEIIDLYTCDRA